MELKKIIFATTNAGKIEEAKAILQLEVVPLKIELEEIQSVDFKEVISHKAMQAYNIVGEPVLVEDSGIMFHAFSNLPGVFTKWFYQAVGNEGMVKMLQPFENKKATAISYLGLYTGKKMVIACGEIEGTIVPPRGEKGFGWDPLFIPDGYSQTFAEMDSKTKNTCSMRRKAFNALLELLENEAIVEKSDVTK